MSILDKLVPGLVRVPTRLVSVSVDGDTHVDDDEVRVKPETSNDAIAAEVYEKFNRINGERLTVATFVWVRGVLVLQRTTTADPRAIAERAAVEVRDVLSGAPVEQVQAYVLHDWDSVRSIVGGYAVVAVYLDMDRARADRDERNKGRKQHDARAYVQHVQLVR